MCESVCQDLPETLADGTQVCVCVSLAHPRAQCQPNWLCLPRRKVATVWGRAGDLTLASEGFASSSCLRKIPITSVWLWQNLSRPFEWNRFRKSTRLAFGCDNLPSRSLAGSSGPASSACRHLGAPLLEPVREDRKKAVEKQALES